MEDACNQLPARLDSQLSASTAVRLPVRRLWSGFTERTDYDDGRKVFDQNQTLQPNEDVHK